MKVFHFTFSGFWLIFCCAVISLDAQNIDSQSVKIWEEELVLPTYLVDPPEKSPMFFKNDSYQGASRVLYPYPLEDDFTGEKVDKAYKAVYLENEYLKVCILPEIGGRLFYATDKTNGYEIFYRQHVIKPAHIGMLGAWISGGIEFCVFHHHRATTNMPVDYDWVQNPDGSATLWLGETELRHQMKWTLGISLYPGKSYLELDGRLINSTENVNSMLYWANVATSVNEDYQVIFPPSTEFTTFHAKNSFAHWPVTQEAYRGNPYYENQIDASWWKNHPTQNSFFAHDIKEGFLAGYDHGKEAGTMHIGNPHIVKGAKLWEWGRGSYWDTHVLTDDDGPYAEIMSGAYSDNQPDYSWIKPYEYKSFKQYWFPMRASKGAVAANLQGLLNLQVEAEDTVFLAVNTTSALNKARLQLTRHEQVLFEQEITVAPDKPYQTWVEVERASDQAGMQLSLWDETGLPLLSYTPVSGVSVQELPEPVTPPVPPQEISSVEELYFTGLRIKQFHNARISPISYFEEALKRDPLDSRSNTQLGIYYKERGDVGRAAAYFRTALVRPTQNYTRPRNCEAFYHLGLILKAQGKTEAAYDTLYRAAWDHAYTAPAYFHLAQISSQRGAHQQALVELDRSLMNNGSNLNALHLKAAILRHLGETDQAKKLAEHLLSLDRLHFGAWNEMALLSGAQEDFEKLRILMRDNPDSYLSLSLMYQAAGMGEDARTILERAHASTHELLATFPTILYYLGYMHHIEGDTQVASSFFELGRSQSIDYCFPFRLETIPVLQVALSYHSEDSRAFYYLGNLLYDKQPELAIQNWKQAVRYEPTLAMAHRNLGWGYYRHERDLEKALEAYEKAILHGPQYVRFFDEIDRLFEQHGTPIEKRYKLLTEHHETVSQHSSALVREALVSIPAGDYDRAIQILTTHYFNRQEGRSGLHDLYVDVMLLRGADHLKQGNWNEAQADFDAADLYPENQSIGRDEQSERRAQIFYYQGVLAEKMGKKKQAKSWFEKAVAIEVQQAEYFYHKALAFRRLGNDEAANEMIKSLRKAGRDLIEGEKEVDFFSKFGGEQDDRLKKASGNYLIGLAHLGEEEIKQAGPYFTKASELDPGHAWARFMLSSLP